MRHLGTAADNLEVEVGFGDAAPCVAGSVAGVLSAPMKFTKGIIIPGLSAGKAFPFLGRSLRIDPIRRLTPSGIMEGPGHNRAHLAQGDSVLASTTAKFLTRLRRPGPQDLLDIGEEGLAIDRAVGNQSARFGSKGEDFVLAYDSGLRRPQGAGAGRFSSRASSTTHPLTEE